MQNHRSHNTRSISQLRKCPGFAKILQKQKKRDLNYLNSVFDRYTSNSIHFRHPMLNITKPGTRRRPQRRRIQSSRRRRWRRRCLNRSMTVYWRLKQIITKSIQKTLWMALMMMVLITVHHPSLLQHHEISSLIPWNREFSFTQGPNPNNSDLRPSEPQF